MSSLSLLTSMVTTSLKAFGFTWKSILNSAIEQTAKNNTAAKIVINLFFIANPNILLYIFTGSSSLPSFSGVFLRNKRLISGVTNTDTKKLAISEITITLGNVNAS